LICFIRRNPDGHIAYPNNEAVFQVSVNWLLFDFYNLTEAKSTMDDLEKQMEPEAEKRVKIGLIMTELAKDNKFGATEKEIEEAIAKRTEFMQGEEKENAKKYLESADGRHQVENAVIGQKVMDYLFNTCTK
jgi:FKBP-type peptidyl-prolyl cis-trans isomerase (trigger factor)